MSHSPAFDKSSGTRTPGATPCRPQSPIHLSIPTRSLCDLLSTRCTAELPAAEAGHVPANILLKITLQDTHRNDARLRPSGPPAPSWRLSPRRPHATQASGDMRVGTQRCLGVRTGAPVKYCRICTYNLGISRPMGGDRRDEGRVRATQSAPPSAPQLCVAAWTRFRGLGQKELLGHSSITTTMDIYTHPEPGLLRSAVDSLGAALSSTTQEHTS